MLGGECSTYKRVREENLEKWLLENILPAAKKYNLTKKAKKNKLPDIGRIKSKMDKLKDLYLNDLIERDIYESEYTSLRDSLFAAEQQTKDTEECDIHVIKTAIEIYEDLTLEKKKEFWTRAIKKIEFKNNSDFFVHCR